MNRWRSRRVSSKIDIATSRRTASGSAMSSDCLFCRIIAGEVPATQIYADDSVVAIRDIAPQAPTHVLLLARKHIASVGDLDRANHDLMGAIFSVGAELAKREGIAEDGYRLVVNVGRNGGQTVDHLHVHLLGGRHMAWPPG
jgi:histidine triad (HIT) family protein